MPRLDNNPAERAIRPLAIGRKNWLFLGSEKSGEAPATLLSLVQTCKALNINPRSYLEDVCRRIMGHNANSFMSFYPMNGQKHDHPEKMGLFPAYQPSQNKAIVIPYAHDKNSDCISSWISRNKRRLEYRPFSSLKHPLHGDRLARTWERSFY